MAQSVGHHLKKRDPVFESSAVKDNNIKSELQSKLKFNLLTVEKINKNWQKKKLWFFDKNRNMSEAQIQQCLIELIQLFRPITQSHTKLQTHADTAVIGSC